MKALKGFFFGFLALILVFIGLGSTLWYFPQLILTPERATSLLRQFAGDFFSSPPTFTQFSIRSAGWTGKHFEIMSGPFCLKDPEACFDQVQIGFSLNWAEGTHFILSNVGPVEIINHSLLIQPSKLPTSEPDSKSSFPWGHFSVGPGFRIEKVKVDFPDIKIKDGQTMLQGRLSAMGPTSEVLDVKAEMKNSLGLIAEGSIYTGFLMVGDSPFRAELRARDGWKIDALLEGKISWEKLTFALGGEIKIHGLTPWIRHLEFQKIRVDRSEQLKVDSVVTLEIEPKIQLRNRSSAMPKASFATQMSGKLELIQEKSIYHYRLNLGPSKDHGMVLEAEAKGDFPFLPETEYRFGLQKIGVSVHIPEFQTLVRSLKNTNVAIPAPFSALRGNAELQIGDLSAPVSEDQIPVVLNTSLDSKEQSFKTKSEGKIEFQKQTKRIRIEGSTQIQKLVLTVPNIDPLIPEPAIKIDSRITTKTIVRAKVKKEEKKQPLPASKVDFSWKVRSDPQSIRVFYAIFHPNAPLSAKLDFSGSDLSLELNASPFDLEYLNRKAKVQILQYGIDTKTDIQHYVAQLVIYKTDYTITVDIRDNGGKPNVLLTSEPPLDQSDIISVLLFNQTNQELTPDESSSVSNTQSAVENRALGLFSMWALSNTPIEAVSYDPASKVYSARVKLANGLVGTIGTDWDNTQQVALRKRLGKRFVLTTLFEDDQSTDTRSTKTLLEWFRRF